MQREQWIQRAGVLALVTTLVFTVMVMSGCQEEKKDDTDGTSYWDLVEDVEVDTANNRITLKSYDEGDRVTITDTILYVQYGPCRAGGTGTVIYFESYPESKWSESGIPMGLGFQGNRSDEYKVGDTITLTLTVKRNATDGSEYFEEWMEFIHIWVSQMNTGGGSSPMMIGTFSMADHGTDYNYTLDIASASGDTSITSMEVHIEDDSGTPVASAYFDDENSASDGVTTVYTGQGIPASDGAIRVHDNNGDGKLNAGDAVNVDPVGSTWEIGYELVFKFFGEQCYSTELP